MDVTTFVALYRGRTISNARLVAVSCDPEVVTMVARRLFSQCEGESHDPALAALEEGRKEALEQILKPDKRDETHSTQGPQARPGEAFSTAPLGDKGKPALDGPEVQCGSNVELRFSADYRHAVCRHGSFIFTPTQARVVEALHTSFQDRVAPLSEALIQEQAEFQSPIRKVFKGHPALETLIVRCGRGLWQLNP